MELGLPYHVVLNCGGYLGLGQVKKYDIEDWMPSENKFKCPCHGSGFYKNGINFEGPAPRPLERFKITLSDTGEIMVDKTKKFQQEKGEWTDPESFVSV